MSSNRVAVLLAPGFEEIEAVAIIDILRRAEVDTVALAVGGGKGLDVKGSHGITVRADRTLAEGADEPWRMIVLPGGLPGAHHLRDDPAVQQLLERQGARGGMIGAICAAPIALGKAGLLQGRKATSYPGFEEALVGAKLSRERVVRDGNIWTSRGPGTAIDFALELVAALASPEVAARLRAGMLVEA